MLGTVKEPEFLLFGCIRLRSDAIVTLVSYVLRLISATLRIRLDDRSGFSRCADSGGCIVVLWHNRLFVAPHIFRIFCGHRKGMVALTSASGEGTVLTKILARFGIDVVRGSSSRRGAAATRELADKLKNGFDIAISPDGPRGPRYKVRAGAIYLAQKTGAPILPVHIHYSWAITLPTWDRFMIPMPFSRVDVQSEPLFAIPPCEGDVELEQYRNQLEQVLSSSAGR